MSVEKIANLLASIVCFSMCVAMWTSNPQLAPSLETAAAVRESLGYAGLAVMTLVSGGAIYYFATLLMHGGKGAAPRA